MICKNCGKTVVNRWNGWQHLSGELVCRNEDGSMRYGSLIPTRAEPRDAQLEEIER
jgi:hypothetical protein